jgi:hypothetical protein
MPLSPNSKKRYIMGCAHEAEIPRGFLSATRPQVLPAKQSPGAFVF